MRQEKFYTKAKEIIRMVHIFSNESCLCREGVLEKNYNNKCKHYSLLYGTCHDDENHIFCLLAKMDSLGMKIVLDGETPESILHYLRVPE